MRRFELAERYYLRALNLEPENTQTLNNLGYSYLMQGRYDLALAHLKDAIALDPMNDMGRDNRQQAEASLELDTRDFLASAATGMSRSMASSSWLSSISCSSMNWLQT